ncbi:hypothetical protein FWF48_03355 [Candidatus Saccharibacteria bacterium]|nr:hypothetical protein [Candidatus Saccharibacteria bacterium]
MAKKLNKQSSFRKAFLFTKKHRISVVLVLVFFFGFLSAGLVYMMVTGELHLFGSTVWVDRTNIDITNIGVQGGDSDDTVSALSDGKTLMFHLEFDAINTPKYVRFCLKNDGNHNVHFDTPIVTPPTDPNIHITWPALDGVTLNTGQTLCNSLTQIEVYYTAMPAGAPYSTTMSMSIDYEQD